jgi:rhamnosyltransferase
MAAKPVKNSIAGMVTLYNSEWAVLQSIDTYISQVDLLYLVDNSEVKDGSLIDVIVSAYPSVVYISNEGNKGIATALNVAARTAVASGFSYLLMMDDDSLAPPEMVSELYRIMTGEQVGRIGIVASQSDPSVQRDDEQFVLTAITSGSLLNLEAYTSVGPFLDDLFIDWVDHEYCFRLTRNGYRILMANRVHLNHRLGVFKNKRMLGLFPVQFRSHNPTRLYYKFRNSLHVIRDYSRDLPLSFVLAVYYELATDLVKVTFVEDDKRAYRKAIQKAIKDFYKRRLGKLN